MREYHGFSWPETVSLFQPIPLGIAGVALFLTGLLSLPKHHNKEKREDQDGSEDPGLVKSLLLFCYSCFLKPHSEGNKKSQQSALESFYASQAGVVCVRSQQNPPDMIASNQRFPVRCHKKSSPQGP